MHKTIFATLSLGTLVCIQTAAGAATCESLASLALPNAIITSAETVAAGAFMPPAGGGPGAPNPAAFKQLPPFCRVAATLKPSSDSDIKIEVWMPSSGWNGKLQSVGGGGWAGIISYPALATSVAAGYASASTDTGHVGGNAQFALGHPEKLVDYAYRSVHEMTVQTKAILAAFYGNGPKLSYWNGCSTGGKQGLTEAQRYPDDYDGIIAGAPANYMLHLHIWSLWVAQAVHKDEASYIPPTKYPLIHEAVIKACDAMDGVKDGLLEDPRKCHFDPKELECKEGNGPSCLSSSQVEAARKLYSPATNPRSKAEIFPPLERGSEMGWGFLAGPKEASVASDTFKYVIFKDPNWDFMKLNFDSDVALADKVDGGLNNAINPDLKKFFGHNGKLLMYHGWNDQLIAPRNSINYYNSVLKATDKGADSMRLFMAPGMNHCRGGEGPSDFDAMSAMEQWVEKGQAPKQMVAAHTTAGKVDRTRPLCPYPQVASYKGSGSIDDAASFVCKAP